MSCSRLVRILNGRKFGTGICLFSLFLSYLGQVVTRQLQVVEEIAVPRGKHQVTGNFLTCLKLYLNLGKCKRQAQSVAVV